MTDDQQRAREQFEAWATAEGYCVSRLNGHNYLDVAVHAAWDAWQAALRAAPEARPLDEWHEDYGYGVWFTWEDGQWLGEPSYIGNPNCDDWPGYHTHWIPHPEFPAPPARPQGVKDDN